LRSIQSRSGGTSWPASRSISLDTAAGSLAESKAAAVTRAAGA